MLETLEPRMVLSATAAPQLVLDPQEYDPATILVRFQPGAAAMKAHDVLPGASNGQAFSSVPGLQVVTLGPGNSVKAALHAFRSNPNVLYAEPNYRVEALKTPNDPSFGALYGMDIIDAPQAWDITTGNGSVVVGVIDTGVDYTHPDLNDNIWTNPGEIPGNNTDDDLNGYVDDVHGYDFVNNDGDPYDDHYHGTHVSGTIGGEGNNGIGVAGVNWDVQIMGLKFLDSGGSGYTAGAIAAVNYATMMRTQHGVNIRVTSNSWGGGGYDQALLDAINASGNAGILFVAAAGNSGSDADTYPMYPAAYDSDNIISVAATDSSDNIAYFSNWGLNSVDLGAPGVDTLSTMPGNNYGTLSGTSMATPHVSGVAALAWSLNPNATPAEIRSAILGNVDPIDALNTNGPTPVATGGRLNAFKTLQALGMAVAGSDPAPGSIIATTPTDFVVNFSHPYDPNTVDVNGSDLTVNGIAATSRTLTDGDTVTFHFVASPVIAQGLQTMHMAAGAISAATGSGLPDPLLHEWNATFRRDLVRMEIDSVSPGGPLAGVPLTNYEVNLNEPVDPLSVSESDLALSLGAVTAYEVLPGNTTIRFTLDGITSDYAGWLLDASIGAGAFTDAFGNPNLPFARTYELVTGMGVAGSTPAQDEIVGPTAPTEFVVSFTFPVVPSTLQPTDLEVYSEGSPAQTANSVILSADHQTATFTFASTPVSAQGLQTMHIAAGAVSTDASSGLPSENWPVLEWTATFRYDATPLEVTSTNPTGPLVALPLTTFEVNLNEPVDPASVDDGDLGLSQGFVIDSEVLPGNKIRFTLGGVTAEGTLDVSIPAGALTDGFGNPNVAFAGSYALDIGTVAYPTPLVPITPLGSLIYDPTAAGIIGAAGDLDKFTINVDGNQTITVLVTPSGTLRPTVAIGGTSVTATNAGKKALLQTLAAGAANTIIVSGADGTTGSYTVQVLLNAALENESNDGNSNNSPATAQSLTGSFTPLLNGATRGAVLGQTDANQTSTLLAADFETLTGDNNWTIANVTNGLWHQSIGHRYEAGHSATHSMYFGTGEKYVQKGRNPETFTKGTYEVTKKVGKGAAQPQIVAGTITSRNIVLESGGLITVDFNYILQTQGSTTRDLAQLQIKPIGGSWTTLASYNGSAESSVWRAANTVDISAYSGQTVQLRFNFDTVDAQNNKFEGWYVDDIVVRRSAPHDNYSITVGANQYLTVALQSPGDVNVLLQNALGTSTLAAGASGAVNVSKMIYNYGPLAAGTYNLAITGQTNTPYTMVVLRDAVFDYEVNDTSANAQPLGLTHVALGSLSNGDTVTLNAYDSGWWNSFGDHDEFNENYIAGRCCESSGDDYRDFFVFDLAGLSHQIAAAELRIVNPYGGYFSPDATETYTLFDISTPLANLQAGGSGQTAIFNDLGTGSSHGSQVVSYADDGQVVSVNLNSAGVAALNASLGGQTALGGAVTTLSGGADQHIFGYSGGDITQLVLTLADPADWYKFTAAVGETIVLDTATPGDGVGEPGNTLNPHIELFNSLGVKVEDTHIVLDAQGNEKITYKVPAGAAGTYRVKVTAESGSGDYVLDPISIAPASPPALSLLASAKTNRGGATATSAPVGPVNTAALQPASSSRLNPAGVDQALAASASGSQPHWLNLAHKANLEPSLLDLLSNATARGGKIGPKVGR